MTEDSSFNFYNDIPVFSENDTMDAKIQKILQEVKKGTLEIETATKHIKHITK